MRIAMPSPKGTNHENLFLTGRVAELVARRNPVGAYDSKHGLQLGYDQVDTPPSQERDDICDSLARLLGFLKTSLRNDAYKQAAHRCPLYPPKADILRGARPVR